MIVLLLTFGAVVLLLSSLARCIIPALRLFIG